MTPATAATARPTDRPEILIPSAADGAAVHALIGRCPPLDRNSLYCNLLQCTHFAETCALAREDGATLGFVSGYRPPPHAQALFVWQVAVDPRARGRGLARALILDILAREACRGVRFVHTTVTAGNAASRAMFARLAGALETRLQTSPHFDREAHLDGAHDSEELLVIGPFARPTCTGESHHHVRPCPGPTAGPTQG